MFTDAVTRQIPCCFSSIIVPPSCPLMTRAGRLCAFRIQELEHLEESRRRIGAAAVWPQPIPRSKRDVANSAPPRVQLIEDPLQRLQLLPGLSQLPLRGQTLIVGQRGRRLGDQRLLIRRGPGRARRRGPG